MPALLKKYQDRENGFTLVELLIVVLIIGVLAAIAIPVYLGIQNQSHKAAVRADTNIGVKKVQVSLTEGATITSLYSTVPGSEKGETVQVKASTTTGASNQDFMVIGNETTSGSPKGAVDYTYQYDSVTGKFSDSDSGDIALGGAQVTLAITTSALADANTTDTYSQTISVSSQNTSGSNVFTITGLPTGLSYSTTTGTITGTPTTTGTATVVVKVANGATNTSRTYNLNVASKPVITTTSLPNAANGSTYSQTITATGSGSPATFTYAVTSGSLPAGLNLSAAGVLSGTPTTTGPYTFAIAATNAAGTGQAQSYTITVGTTPTITAGSSSDTVIWPAFSQIAYTPSDQPVTTGYPSPNVTATNLPAGLSISTAGVISGTPATAGAYNFTLNATNTFGTATKNVTMNVVNGNNNYQEVVDSVQSNSTGMVTFTGWAVGQIPGTPGGSTSGDTSKANLRVDVYIDNTNYDFYSTNASRPDVNAAFGGNIGNNHGYNITLPTTSGSHTMRIYLRDSNSANGSTLVYNSTVVVK